jgi:chromosome segregation protein
MRLVSLKLKGFKSFAQETFLHFNDDVIGIVGPNGSGKSNIIDAIRWVLGEQKTTELRLESMSNVLFNGTKKRKPSPYAEVCITFENNKGLLPLEFKTIAITRIIHRSGNSEYLINDVTCRLKDIHTLLSDTGIGSDTYAIIALGMVDEILSDRDAYRRRMMEQAAGISKYKLRKKEALQKLSLTDEDLIRVEDLLAEIGSNLKSLEKQAKKAKRYFEIKDKYKELSLSMAKVQLDTLDTDYVHIEKIIQQELDAFHGMQSKLSLLESELINYKQLITAEEELLSKEQQQLAVMIQELRDLENKKTLLSERKQQVQNQLKHNFEKSESLNSQRVEFQKKDTLLELTLSHGKEELDKLNLELNEIKALLESEREKHMQQKLAIQEVFQKIRGFEQEINLTEKTASSLNANIRHLEQSTSTFNADYQMRMAELDNNKEHLERMIKEIETLNAHKVSLQTQESERLQQIEENNAIFQVKQQELLLATNKLSSLTNEYELTRSLVDNLEGYPESIRFLSKQQEWIKHAILFSDILICDESYKVSLENFLEPFLNYYIVPDRSTALQAIQLLSSSQRGKAHFFVLSGFEKINQVPTDLSTLNLIPAISVVQTEDLYLPLMNYLFDNVYFIENHTDPGIIDNLPENITIINKTGDVIVGKKKMSGGSVGLFEGKKLGRKRNLEVLEKDIKTASKERVSIEKELEVIRIQNENLKQKTLKSEIDSVSNQLHQKEQVYNKTLAKFELENSNLKLREEKNNANLIELASLKSQFADKEHAISELKLALKNYQTEAEKLDLDFKVATDEMAAISTKFNEVNIKTIQQNSKVELFERDLKYNREQLDKIQHSIKELEDNTVANNLKDEQTDIALAETDRQVLAIIVQRKDTENTLSQAEQQFYEKKNLLIEKENQIRELNRQLHQTQVIINQHKDKFTDLRFKVNRILERLSIEFGVTKEEIQEFNSKINGQNEESLVHEIEQMKQKLQGFNDINPLAMEAFDVINERYKLIEAQRDDILNAKNNLLSTIEEIDGNARTKFLFTFEQIRENFTSVFRNLFTEDDFCDIILEDPDQPLESGIQIIAKPKGKRPQTLHQLSGGEKTLTAIAFLFSIYLIKPAPFCIFDEVDAPLDDANIEKFTRIVRNFSKQSQFIVVTHNKGTMADVNSIYGVFMEEQGISNLSRVDFSAFKHSGLFETLEA